MAGELIGALRVSLGLDSAKFETGLKKSRAQAKADATAIQKSLDGIKGRMDAVFAGVSAGALIAAGKRALDYASSLGEVAQQLGVTTKELQEYRYAASQVGISNDEMDKSLAKLTRTMGEAKAGSKEQATVFRELGVSIQDANGRVYTAGEVIPKLADALSRIKDPATRAKLEVELFGKAGQKLDTLLSGGSKAINGLRDAAHRLGVVLSEDQIRNADETADRLSDLKQVLEANIAGAVASNAKAILGLANALATLSGEAAKYIGKYPGLAGALAGAAVGSRFGAPGAAAGAALGSIGGAMAKDSADDQNMDLRFRQQKMRAARAEYKRRQTTEKEGGPLFAIRRTNSPRSGGTLDSAFTEYKRQVGLLGQSVAAAKGTNAATAAVVGDGALPSVAGTSKKAKGPTASDRAENYAQELARAKNEQLGLQQDINSDVRERARLEHERIETERAAYEFDLDTKVKAGQLNAADAERLKIIANRNAELKNTAVNWQLDDMLAQEELDVRRDSLAAYVERLSGQSHLARTAGKRRDIELKILDAQFEIYRLEQLAIKNKHAATEAEKLQAQGRLDALPGLKSSATASVNLQNASPLAAYFNSLPQSAAEVNEAFENVAANGIANMVDGIADAGANVLKLKGFAGQLFNQLIADVIRLNLQQAMGGGGILGSLGKLFGAVGGAGAFGSTIASNNAWLDNFSSPAVPGLTNLPGFANGGTFRVNGRSGIDTNTLALNGVPVARVNTGERITVDPQKAERSNAGVRVDVVPSQYFDAHVSQISASTAAPMAMNAASAGSELAQQRIAKRGRNRIPSRF